MGEAEARSHLEAGEEHLRREEWGEAEAAFRAAVSAFPDSPVAHSKLGAALAHQRRFDEAIAVLRAAIQLNPRYAAAHNNLGNVQRELGRFDEALQAYQRAVDADPDYWVAHQNLGALYRQMGRVGEAIAEYRKAARLSARSGRAPRGCASRAAVLTVLALGTGVLFLAGMGLRPLWPLRRGAARPDPLHGSRARRGASRGF